MMTLSRMMTRRRWQRRPVRRCPTTGWRRWSSMDCRRYRTWNKLTAAMCQWRQTPAGTPIAGALSRSADTLKESSSVRSRSLAGRVMGARQRVACRKLSDNRATRLAVLSDDFDGYRCIATGWSLAMASSRPGPNSQPAARTSATPSQRRQRAASAPEYRRSGSCGSTSRLPTSTSPQVSDLTAQLEAAR